MLRLELGLGLLAAACHPSLDAQRGRVVVLQRLDDAIQLVACPAAREDVHAVAGELLVDVGVVQDAVRLQGAGSVLSGTGPMRARNSCVWLLTCGPPLAAKKASTVTAHSSNIWRVCKASWLGTCSRVPGGLRGREAPHHGGLLPWEGDALEGGLEVLPAPARAAVVLVHLEHASA